MNKTNRKHVTIFKKLFKIPYIFLTLTVTCLIPKSLNGLTYLPPIQKNVGQRHLPMLLETSTRWMKRLVPSKLKSFFFLTFKVSSWRLLSFSPRHEDKFLYIVAFERCHVSFFIDMDLFSYVRIFFSNEWMFTALTNSKYINKGSKKVTLSLIYVNFFFNLFGKK